jgi:tetratricopeptide (TPR) repeat protein
LELFHSSLAVYREHQNDAGVAMVLNNMGRALLEQGQLDEAALQLNESLRLRYRLGDLPGVAFSLEGLADLARRRGDVARAARLWGAAEALRAQLKAPLSPMEQPSYQQIVAESRAALGEGDFAAAWAAGAGLSVEEAVAAALG